MESKKQSGDESGFDHLLHQAQWLEPPGEQLARMRENWQAIARRRRTRRRYGGLALAASILLAVGALVWREMETRPAASVVAQNEPADVPDVQSTTRAEPPADSPAPSPVAISTAAEPQPAGRPIAARDANQYERIVLMSAATHRRPKSREPVRSKPADDPTAEWIEELIVALANDPKADVGERLPTIESKIARYEPLLWAAVRQGSAERRLGAARLLSKVGTPQSLPVLTGLLNDPASHKLAILGLGRLAGAQDLAQLVSAEQDADLRRHLLAALLARRTEESVALYLDFVTEPVSRSDALGALGAMADPPADLLFAFLECPERSQRLAAAQSLARLRDPQVVRRLSELVPAGIGRQEALIALLLSPSAQAARFLTQARENLYLVAAVQAAEQQLYSLTISRGGNLP